MNLIKYEFADNMSKERKGIRYVIAKNGNFSVRENGILKVTTKLAAGFDTLPEISEGLELKLPKIPFELFNHMVSFFKKVYDKDKTESSLFIFWSEAKGYFLWAPKQKNGGASSTYQRDEDPEYTQMCKDNTLCMMAHSHPWKGTSVHPSGIDDKDEKDILLYLVVGNVEAMPNVYMSTCPNGVRKQLNFFDVFNNPLHDYLESLPEDIKSYLLANLGQNDVKFAFEKALNVDVESVPDEWMNKCEKTVYAAANNKNLKSYSSYDETAYYNDYLNYPNASKFKNYSAPTKIQKNKKSSVSTSYEPDDLYTILEGLPQSMAWLKDLLAADPAYDEFLPEGGIA